MRINLKLDNHEVQALHIAVHLQLNTHGIGMIDETPCRVGTKVWYAETSHVDQLVRLYVRLNRILTGHRQYNAVIPYTEAPECHD